MPRILTAEDVVGRIAAECAYVDERGGVGIRLSSSGLRARPTLWIDKTVVQPNLL
jgi:hypothetical protein